MRAALRVLLVACACAGAHAAPLEVRVAAQEALEPNWLHDGDSVAGTCPAIMAAVERIEPRLRFAGYQRSSRSLSGIEAGLDTGTLDAACGLVSSPHRLAIGQPVDKPIFFVRHYLAVRKDDPVATSSRRSARRCLRSGCATPACGSTMERVRVLPAVLGDEPMYFRVGHRADPALAPLPGAALDRLKASGELDRIYARWADLAP